MTTSNDGNAPTTEPTRLDTANVVPRLNATGITIGVVRWTELRAISTIQRRAFRPRLAYGWWTLALLTMLPPVRFLVARVEGRVIGCVIGDRHQGDARIINIAVDPDFRRRGVGAGLLLALENAIPEGDVVLMVERENDSARALYLRLGYEHVGIARDYYGRGHHGDWMRKRRVTLPRPTVRI